MRLPDEDVAIKHKDFRQVLRFLEQLVVSLDRVGSSSNFTDISRAELLLDFHDRFFIFRQAANLRSELSSYLDEEEDSDEGLEEFFEDTEYWSISTFQQARKYKPA